MGHWNESLEVGNWRGHLEIYMLRQLGHWEINLHPDLCMPFCTKIRVLQTKIL